MANKYDIFISYRHQDGAQYARILQLQLEKRGYKAFLDYEELTDGVFGDHIKSAIAQAKVFVMVLTPHYLESCHIEGNWVRQEILLAQTSNCHIVPVNPDNLFDKMPDSVPMDIRKIVADNQYSEVNFGQAQEVTIDLMITNRIEPYIRLKFAKRHRIVVGAILVITIGVIIGGCMGVYMYYHKQKQLLMTDRFEQFVFLWKPSISLPQLRVVHEILGQMQYVASGTYQMGLDSAFIHNIDEAYAEMQLPQLTQQISDFYISQYEVNVQQWNTIMGEKYKSTDALLPQTNVSFEQCQAFVAKLEDLTGLPFALPSEAQWEYAARGGGYSHGYLYAGANQPDHVAWFASTSRGQVHACDAAHSPMYCNELNLYDMSGNVSEWCNTPFRLYQDLLSGTTTPEIIDPDAMVLRGGNYLSSNQEVTISYREPMNKNTALKTVGLRLILVK